MREYRPALFTTPIKLLAPGYQTVNDIYAIEDTAVIETWYRPDIRSDCRIMLAENGAVYDILNEPEDMEQRHKYCKFKVQRIKGGA